MPAYPLVDDTTIPAAKIGPCVFYYWRQIIAIFSFNLFHLSGFKPDFAICLDEIRNAAPHVEYYDTLIQEYQTRPSCRRSQRPVLLVPVLFVVV